MARRPQRVRGEPIVSKKRSTSDVADRDGGHAGMGYDVSEPTGAIGVLRNKLKGLLRVWAVPGVACAAVVLLPLPLFQYATQEC